jgi:hypothetical protein
MELMELAKSLDNRLQRHHWPPANNLRGEHLPRQTIAIHCGSSLELLLRTG